MQLISSTPAPENVRSRQLETYFIVERYHRALDAEVAELRKQLRATGHVYDDVARALAVLDERLRSHNLVQEFRVFPAFEEGRRSEVLFEAWATDTLRVFQVIDGVRGTCRSIEDLSLSRRIERLLGAIADHLAVEAKLLAPWSDV